ncbi:MAG: hypothetical protein JO264_00145 [Acidisphaera sp.]|nr:hypothetical protein [Acidisphaera sp.]
MTSTAPRSARFRLLKGAAVAAALLLPLTISSHANAWWRGGVWIGVAPAPYYYAPQPVYVAPPPVVYAPYPAPGPRVWVRPFWNGWRWVPGHWRY